MEIKDQVCSLESAKRLKELGCPQESLFWWFYDGNITFLGQKHEVKEVVHECAAFTVAELGEILPQGILSGKDSDFMCRQMIHYGNGLSCPYRGFRSDLSEAEARAKMLIYLYEQGLIK